MPDVRSSAVAGSVGSVNANASPYTTIPAPAGLAVGDFLVVCAYFAQGTGTGVSIITPPGLTQISPALTGTERTYAVFAGKVTASNLSTFQAGIPLRAGASSTRVAGVALALQSDAGKSFDLSAIEISNITYKGSASTSGSFPGVPGALPDSYLTLNFAMSNKSASTTLTSHSSGRIINQVNAPSAASGSVSDSVVSAHRAAATATFNVSQANSQFITVRAYQIDTPVPANTRHVLRQNSSSIDEYELYIYDGTSPTAASGLKEVESLGVLPQPKTVSEFHLEIIQNKYPRMAHRNIGQTYAECTTRGAFEALVKHGTPYLEFSARHTSDGVLVGSHDSTLDRATQGTGAISSKTWAQIQGTVVDVGGTPLSPTPTVSRMIDYMTWFKDYVMFLDNKDLTLWPDFFQKINDVVPNATEHVVIKVDGAASPVHFQIPKQAGFKVMAYWFASSNFSNLADKMPYVDYPGMAHDAPQATWDLIRQTADAQSAIDFVDRPMWGHVLESEAEVTESISKGARFVQCTRAVCFPSYTAW